MKLTLLSSLYLVVLLMEAMPAEADSYVYADVNGPDLPGTQLVPAEGNPAEQVFDPSWSVDFRVNPQQRVINGQSVSGVSQELTHIELLTCNNDRFFSLEQCRQIEESGGQLQVVMDLNNDGNMERWSTGVAKNRKGEAQKVLVIQDHLTSVVIETIILHDSQPGFSALYQQDGYFMWAMCINCDVFADIVWRDNDFKLSWDWMASAH